MIFVRRVAGLAEIEIEPALAIVGFDSIPAFIAYTDKPNAWRAHQRLLRCRYENIDAPIVLAHFDTAQSTDAVDDQHGIGFANRRSQRFKVGNDTGRALVVDRDNRLVVCRVEFLFHRSNGNRLPPRRLQHVGVQVQGFGDGYEPLTELTVAENQDLVALAQRIGQRGLHDAGSRAGEKQNLVAGANDRLREIRRLRHDLPKFRPSVIEHVPHRGLLDTVWNRPSRGRAAEADREVVLCS